MCEPGLRLLNVAVDCQTSGLPFPIMKYPAPVLVMVKAPLKVLLPGEASELLPFFVETTVPPKLQPLNNRVGLTVVIFPPIAEEGPKVRLPVPVNVRLLGVVPSCVNWRSHRRPAEKPADPIARHLPAASVA